MADYLQVRLKSLIITGTMTAVSLVSVLSPMAGGGAARDAVAGAAQTSSLSVLARWELVPPSASFPAFDTRLAANAPVSVTSRSMAASVVYQYQTHYGDFGVQDQNPIVFVGPQRGGVTVSVQPGCNNFEANVGQVPLPPRAATLLTGSSDNPLIVWQPSTNSEWEFWKMAYFHGQWSACWGGRITGVPSSSGRFQAPYGQSASGLAYLPLIITEADVASGSINHPVAIQMPVCRTFVSPATRTDCQGAAGTPSEGMHFRLPSTLPMPAGLTPFARMVFTALQRYGAYVTDRSGAVDIVTESPSDWHASGAPGPDPITNSWAGAPQWNTMGGIPWGQMLVVS